MSAHGVTRLRMRVTLKASTGAGSYAITQLRATCVCVRVRVCRRARVCVHACVCVCSVTA